MPLKKYILPLILVAFCFSCKDAYRPDVISIPQAYLVVEGVLNAGGPTTILVSRTTPLDSVWIKPENNATLTVEGKDNTTRSLTQSGSGVYTSSNLNLVINTDYRLRIRTSAGKEYLSEYVTAKVTPEIDSVGWKRDANNVFVYVNTHDATNNTHYYRWDFDETWEIQSYYYSKYIYTPVLNTVRERTPSEDVHIGWKNNKSTRIVQGSSTQLQSDVIFQAPVNVIPKGDERLSVRYSILVKQYAMDKNGFEFYEQMRRNTESLGTIFDTQPSEVKGNVQCVSDPTELVIGYITASTVTEKRLFISRFQLPSDWKFYEYCPEETVANHPDSLKISFGGNLLSPYEAVYAPNLPIIIGYLSSYPVCVDCTKRGASLVRPAYW